ncbi:MAG: glycosyl hydrolase family 65 protein [Actinomycetota bacterium]
MGHLDLAYDYLAEAALMDLGDLHNNTRNGVHIAALAGGWMALVAGFGGLRARQGTLCFAPRLPDALSRMAFNLFYRGRRLSVSVTPSSATYTLQEGISLELIHCGEAFKLTAAEPVTRPIPPAPVRDRPIQPPGRAPMPRRQHH